MEQNNVLASRLENMSNWIIDDFIFYADMLDGAFVFNVEYDPEKPEIGWSLFQKKLEEAKIEFQTSGHVVGFERIDTMNEAVQRVWQSQNN